MQFKIISINENEGTIKVLFDVDNVEQTFTAPIDNIDALNDFLFDYGTAYEAGLAKSAQPQVAPEVEALVGQSIDLALDSKGTITSSISLTPPVKEVVL